MKFKHTIIGIYSLAASACYGLAEESSRLLTVQFSKVATFSGILNQKWPIIDKVEQVKKQPDGKMLRDGLSLEFDWMQGTICCQLFENNFLVSQQWLLMPDFNKGEKDAKILKPSEKIENYVPSGYLLLPENQMKK